MVDITQGLPPDEIGVAICQVLREYNNDIVPLIDNYVNSAVTWGRVFSSTPPSKIRRVISDEIKMATDHLGRAIVRESSDDITMSRWHLNQIKLLTLMPLTKDLSKHLK